MREGESAVTSLELKPVPVPIVGWIWVGVTISLIILAFLMMLAQPSNPVALALLFIALTFFPLGLPVPGRTPRRLELSDVEVRFLKGTQMAKSLLWNRVEKIEYGPMEWHRKRRTVRSGPKHETAYIRFIASTDLESIRITGLDHQLKPDEVEDLVLAIARLTKLHSIPVEKKEWLY